MDFLKNIIQTGCSSSFDREIILHFKPFIFDIEMFNLYGLHVVFLYCKLTQFSWSKHSLLLKYILMREYQLYRIYNTSTQYKVLL